MSQTVVLQADLAGWLKGSAEGSRSIPVTIPSGTVLTLTNARDTDEVAEALAIISPAVLAANRSVLDRTIDPWPANTPPFAAGNAVLVTYDAHGGVIYHDFAVSSSVSQSPSLSPSASSSRSPSSSASLSPSSSASPSASASRSPSASASAS